MKPSLPNGAGGVFAALFAGLHGKTPAPSGTVTLGVDGELTRSIKAQLDRGTSLDEVVAQLAGSLAASVANQLGISPQAAHERLTQAFTAALQPTGSGPPQTNAERASSLVSRFRQLAELATRVTNGDTGQPIRLIAGQRSDAEQAKATPAPQPDSILRDALAALAAPTSPALGANIASSPPSDGRTVALDSTAQAIATGGDTLLGRMLARAILAGDQPSTPVILSSPTVILSSPTVILSSSKDGAQASTSGLALRQAQGDVGGALGDTGAASSSSSGVAAVEAFVTAFSSALAREDGSNQREAAKAPSPVSTDPAATPISYAIPLVKDNVPLAPPAPAPVLPQPQHADANAVVDQVLRGIAIRTSDGQSEVRLRLVPESLGDVSVKLVVSGGSVDASITAHTADAQNALAGAQNQLAKTFADAGLRLSSFTVGLAGGGFADGRDSSRQNDASNRENLRRIAGVGTLGLDEPDDASLLAIPSFGPPIFSARALPGTLNYLA